MSTAKPKTKMTRAELVEAVKAGRLSLDEARNLLAHVEPLPKPAAYHGFSGMTSREMCGD